MTFPTDTRTCFCRKEPISELQPLAEPLLQSGAFQRLGRITFLGILSPRFASLGPSPLWPVSWPNCGDGTRKDHSVGVASIALELSRRLGFSASTQRYAAAWGLTHDIATWPLSHTGETAFRRITRTTQQEVRRAMIAGSEQLPSHYHLDRPLRQMGVEPEVLLSLFHNETVLASAELNLFRQVIHSPLTPDTLEGACRAGRVFGITVPSADLLLAAFVNEKTAICLDRTFMNLVMDFWHKKAETYHRFINRPDVILWESAWTLGIKRTCARWSLLESLDAPEEAIISIVMASGLPACSHVVRYKKPQEYVVNGFDMLPAEPPVGELWRVLKRRPLEVPAHD